MLHRRRPVRRHIYTALGLLLLGLTPSLGLARRLWVDGDPSAPAEKLSERQRILARLVDDPTALINVKARDMPASPDILNFGRRSTQALQRCLSDNIEAEIRIQCAVMLEALADPRALATLQGALEDWDPAVRASAAVALIQIPDSTSIDPLLALYRRADEQPRGRWAALRALGTISDQRVVRALRLELIRIIKTTKRGDDESQPLGAVVFEALWANRHLMAERTLVGDTLKALRSNDEALVHAATLAAGSLKSGRLVSALIPLMEHSSPEIRNKAVYALGHIGDDKATAALLAKLPEVRESRMLNNIAFALERLDKRAFYKAMPQVMTHSQAIVRLNAAFVLGDVDHPEGLPLLSKALQDPSDFVRTSAVAAVGKLGATQSVPNNITALLRAFTRDSNLNIRQEAIYALHRIGKGSEADLIYRELFDDPHQRLPEDVRRRAAMELGKLGDVRVRDYVVDCYLHQQCNGDTTTEYVRTTATESIKGRLLLSWARFNLDLTDIVTALRPPGIEHVATSVFEAGARYWSSDAREALHVLGKLGGPRATQAIDPHTMSASTHQRIESWVALARLGDKRAAEHIFGEFDNLPAEHLGHFVAEVARIDPPTVRDQFRPGLIARQQTATAPFALAASAILLRWNAPEALPRFYAALGAKQVQERDLAETYLRRARTPELRHWLEGRLAAEKDSSVRQRILAILDPRHRG